MKNSFITTRQLKEKLNTEAPNNPEKQDLIIRELLQSGNEIEGLNTEFTPLNIVKNVPGSLVDFGKNIWKAVSDPINTIGVVAGTATGGILKLLPDSLVNKEGKELEKQFDAAVNFFADRYGSVERLGETLEKDPFGFLADAATFVSGGANLVAKGSKVAGLSKASQIANKTREVARALDPVNAVGNLAPKLAVDSVRKINKATGVGKFLERKAIERAGKAFKLPENDIYKRLRDFYGKDIEGIMAEIGIHGDPDQVLAQARNLKLETMKVVDDALSKFDTKIKSPAVHSILSETLGAIEGLKNIRSSELNKIKSELKIALKKHSGEIIKTKFPDKKIPGQLTVRGDLPKNTFYFGTNRKLLPGEKINAGELTKFPTVAAKKNKYVYALEPGEGINQLSEFHAEAVGARPKYSFDVPEGSKPADIEYFAKKAAGQIVKTKDKVLKGFTTTKKIPGEGLTLSEINDLRRTFDDLISSKVFTEGGKVKQNIRAFDLKKASGQMRGLLYRKADEFGFSELRDLNHQTMLGKFLEDNVPSMKKEMSAFSSRFDVKTIGEAMFYLPGQNTLRSMKFRSALASKLMTLSGKELQQLKGGVVLGKPNKSTIGIARKLFRDLKPVFPELRLAGIQQENVKQMSNKELKQRSDEVGLGALIEQMEQRR